MNRDEVYEYILETYNKEPQYMWESDPDSAVFKHKSNKWFGIVMKIGKDKLGLDSVEKVDVLNVKCPPEMIGNLRMVKGFFPAYHMNKEHWITMLLDGSVDSERIKMLIDISFEMTDKVSKRGKRG